MIRSTRNEENGAEEEEHLLNRGLVEEEEELVRDENEVLPIILTNKGAVVSGTNTQSTMTRSNTTSSTSDDEDDDDDDGKVLLVSSAVSSISSRKATTMMKMTSSNTSSTSTSTSADDDDDNSNGKQQQQQELVADAREGEGGDDDVVVCSSSSSVSPPSRSNLVEEAEEEEDASIRMVPALPEATTTTKTTTTAANTLWDKKEIHIAPMLHYTTKEFHALFRIMSKHAILWTEMIVDETIVHNYKQNVDILDDDSNDNDNVIFQIGGITVEDTRHAARLIIEYGKYQHINLNLDCPSRRVQGRNFGAILMKDAQHTVKLLQAIQDGMKDAKNGTAAGNDKNDNISVKCRIGVDDCTSLQFMVDFISALIPVCTQFILHARPVLLNGLSPAQNRIIPALNYPRIYKLCELFPQCDFWINGGISGLQMAKQIICGVGVNDDIGLPPRCRMDSSCSSNDDEMPNVQQQHEVPCQLCGHGNGSCTAPPRGQPPSNLRGCMIGRAAMDHPIQFWDIDRYWYGQDKNPCRTRRHILDQYCQFLEETYPRRCCDDNPKLTTTYPTSPHPNRGTLIHTAPHCPICANFDYEPPQVSSTVRHPSKNKQHGVKVKIPSLVLGRCLNPCMGLFSFCDGVSRAFRHECEMLRRDLVIRNCGPAFCLRLAVHRTTISDSSVLDEPLPYTDDWTDVVEHMSPLPCQLNKGRRQRKHHDKNNAHTHTQEKKHSTMIDIK